MRVHQSERQCHKGRFPCSLLFSPQFIIVGQVFLSASVMKRRSVGFKGFFESSILSSNSQLLFRDDVFSYIQGFTHETKVKIPSLSTIHA